MNIIHVSGHNIYKLIRTVYSVGGHQSDPKKPKAHFAGIQKSGRDRLSNSAANRTHEFMHIPPPPPPPPQKWQYCSSMHIINFQ